MVDILLAVAAAQSEYKARQCARVAPAFDRMDWVRIVFALALIGLIVASLSLTTR